MCKKTNYKTSNTQIDKCMRPLIEFLKRRGWTTVACCCGHGHRDYPMTIIVKNPYLNYYYELFTETIIPRKRKFYKKDKQGFYYIPEIMEKIK